MSEWEKRESEVLYRLEKNGSKLDDIDGRLNRIERHLGIIQTKIYFGAAIISFIVTMGIKYLS
tara:strand:+ start:3544 stop:3732 length:189 start_codon:yes stop_codon:yes gene_type:complete